MIPKTHKGHNQENSCSEDTPKKEKMRSAETQNPKMIWGGSRRVRGVWGQVEVRRWQGNMIPICHTFEGVLAVLTLPFIL
jgi:hypothetical protein